MLSYTDRELALRRAAAFAGPDEAGAIEEADGPARDGPAGPKPGKAKSKKKGRKKSGKAKGSDCPPAYLADPPPPPDVVPDAEALPLPGTPQKVELLQSRAKEGKPLHQPGDVLAAADRVVDMTHTGGGKPGQWRKRRQVRVEGGEERRIASTRVNESDSRCSRLVFETARPNKFAERLRILRTARGLTLGQLSLATGVSKAALHLLEHGKRQQPHLCVLWSLADLFGVTLDWLVGRAG